MKEKKLGKKIAIFYIVLAIIVAILGTTVLYQIITNWTKSGELENQADEEIVVEAKDIVYENGWGKDIVSEIKSEIPIPVGFTYVEGSKEDGLIIEEEGTQNKLLWIPYDKDADLNLANEYYKNVNVPEMDSNTYESILKYGGFYVNISEGEEYSELKDVTQDEYNTAVTNAQELYKDKESMDSHVLYKEEIAQILAYTNKLGVNIIKTNSNMPEYTVDKLSYLENENAVKSQKTAVSNTTTIKATSSTINKWTSIDKYVKNSNYKYVIYKTTEGEKVYIPKGFKFFEYSSGSTQYVKIADEDNNDLVYVWIPVENGVNNVKNKIIDKFNELKIPEDQINIEDRYNIIKESLPTALKNSISTAGGFYMAEAELSYTNNSKNVYSTRARDMKITSEGWLASAIEDSQGNVTSDYYRMSYIVQGNESTEEILRKAQNIAENAQKQTSVRSHLAYGVEYDLAILWLIDTGAANTWQLMQDSTSIGKYQNTQEQFIKNNSTNTLEASRYKFLNGLWGLAGNLAELSQETSHYGNESGIVLRGGSYTTNGSILSNGHPAQEAYTVTSSQLKLNDEYNIYNSDSIGIRNCLYIDFGYDSDDYDYDYDYDYDGDYTNWNGRIADEFADGTGSKSDPYIIETPSQLAYLAERVNDGETFANKYFRITNSFDMKNREWTPIGGCGQLSASAGSALGDGKQFRGKLDGEGNWITNLEISSSSNDNRRNIGLIGLLGEGGSISNINIRDGQIEGASNVGAIVGKMMGGVVEDCTNRADITAIHNSKSETGTNCGGIVGADNKGTIKNCTNEGTITAEYQNAGGICGKISNNTTISDNTNTGDVESSEYAGGIVGSQAGGTIEDCTNEGSITADEQGAGGIVGYKTSGTIQSCTNDGEYDAPKYKGKITGRGSQT